MSRYDRLLARLGRVSDRLSPILVKEVRQMSRGREFIFSFGGGLAAGLAVAFFGAADALTGTGMTGQWTFTALMGCLAILGLAVVPLGAFSTLRVERMEQTLDLITLTALTPRRIVVGKLLAQAVKLGTLFAAMAPFIAMSFLLGGIDFLTIVVSLAVLFVVSVWVSAACLFLSTLLKSRAMAALVFGGAAILLLILLTFGRWLLFAIGRGGAYGWSLGYAPGMSGSVTLWSLGAIAATMCAATMVNLILLAENRLALPAENKVTSLRLGFLVQFLLIVGWALSFMNEPYPDRRGAAAALAFFGGLHLALVAMFTVTEDLVVSRRDLRRNAHWPRFNWARPLLRPGGGHGAIYVLVQMALLLAAAWMLEPGGEQIRALLAACGYICLFTGVPVVAFRAVRPARPSAVLLRVVILLLIPLSMLLPDVLYYVFWQPDAMDLAFARRHLLNPFRTLGFWSLVEARQWLLLPFALGFAGLASYLALIHIGMITSAQIAPSDEEGTAAQAEEPDRANVLS